MRLVGRILLGLLAIVGSVTLVVTALLAWMVAQHDGTEPMPDRIVVALDLNRGVVEGAPSGPLAALRLKGAYPLRDVVDALDRAARDDRVVALFARVDQADFGMARAQEIRDAVLAFRKSGKPAVVFAEGFGGANAGTIEYYLASAFDQVWLQPSGDLALTGFMVESPFLRGTLEQLEIKAQFGARHEYKSAIEMFTEKGFTPQGREAIEGLLASWFDQVVAGIAEGRGLAPAEVRAVVDRAPLMAPEALAAKLVDRLGYRDEAEDAAKGGKDAEIMDAAAYLAQAGRPNDSGTRVALIYGVGGVASGDGNFDPLTDNAVMGADTIAKALREATEDDKVKAILLRVDSPGGSYTASDAIWREVKRARQAGKPVVVSMGGMAASGGYFVSMAADRILAQPGTITGSIGVFTGKLVLADFWRKLGVTWDEVHIGANAPMWSSNQPFTAEAWQRMEAKLDQIYADFTTRAGEARGIAPDRMDRVARGRIWSGAQALELGLVDGLGGYPAAWAAVREAAGLAPDAPIDVEVFPRPKGPIEQIMELLETGRLPMAMAELMGVGDAVRLVERAEPLVRAAEAAASEGAALRVPLPRVR